MSAPTLLMSVTVTIKAVDVEAYLAKFQTWYEKTVATPECVFLHAGRQQITMIGAPPQMQKGEDGEVAFVWFEGWSGDATWFHEVQAKKDWFLEFNLETKPLWTKPRIVQVLAQEGTFTKSK